MYESKFKEDKSDVTIAPKGTVLIKVGSHRASDYIRRYDISYVSLYTFDTNVSLYLIKEEDYPKLEKVKGISKPATKVKGKYRPSWSVTSSKSETPEEKKLKDLFYKANP